MWPDVSSSESLTRFTDPRTATGHTSNGESLYVECLCDDVHDSEGIITLESWVFEHATPKKQKRLSAKQELAFCLRVVKVKQADGRMVSHSTACSGVFLVTGNSRVAGNLFQCTFSHIYYQEPLCFQWEW